MGGPLANKWTCARKKASGGGVGGNCSHNVVTWGPPKRRGRCWGYIVLGASDSLLKQWQHTNMQAEIKQLADFKKAKHTVIISDLHLCEAEPVHKKHPLWKKYKTREYFFDEKFEGFLTKIHERARGSQVELILNGDIFDFDSVTAKPAHPTYRISWVESLTGLKPQEDKSAFKIKRILHHHEHWVRALRNFLKQGHRVVFVIGNHDLELHWPQVQTEIIEALDVSEEFRQNIRFNEWFYISNGDTLIEHGNQYDPYCLAEDPINPLIQRFNRLEVRVPFGNLATRYLINRMGFFNPHVDSNFIMSAWEYVKFFFRYMLIAQPQLMLTWLYWSTVILVQSFFDRLLPAVKNPLTIEDRIEWIAAKANTKPRVVREMRELFVQPASSHPLVILRELWLDRAFLIMLLFLFVAQLFLFINNVYKISFFWMFIPLTLFLPFFLFYSKSVTSEVHEYKEPKEKILVTTSMITGVHRVVYGHTHTIRHELIGPVEHLNSGTWSPAFLDVECKNAVDDKTFVWIEPGDDGARKAILYRYENDEFSAVYRKRPLSKKKAELVLS